MKCRYEGTGIWAGRCIGTKEVDPCPGYDKCKEYKPDYMTNADRIRAMSDEELAHFLDEVQEEECNALHEVRQDGTLKFMSLRNGWLKWLKQPVEAVADYLLDNGVTVQQWIAVTERLPDLIPCNAGTAYSEAVIIWTSGRKAMIGVWDGTDFLCAADYWEVDGKEITHWMPLPEPPKGGCRE